MADTTTQKVVTLENLSAFKTKMDASVDEKVAASGGSVTYATDAEIEALFTDSTASDN